MERKIDLLVKNFTDKIDFLFSEQCFVGILDIKSSAIRYDIAEKLNIIFETKLIDLNIDVIRSIFRDDLDIIPFVIDEFLAKYLTPAFLKCGIQALLIGDIFSESFERFLYVSSKDEISKDFDSKKYNDILSYNEVICIIDYISIAINPDMLKIDPSSFNSIKSREAINCWINNFKFRALQPIS